jgi:hypothetical protein
LAFGDVQPLTGQTRLSDPGVGDHNHTVASWISSSRRDRFEFAIPAD